MVRKKVMFQIDWLANFHNLVSFIFHMESGSAILNARTEVYTLHFLCVCCVQQTVLHNN